MEEFARNALQVIRDLAVYEINGVLFVAYGLIAHWAVVLSALCAIGVLTLDWLVKQNTSLSGRPNGPASGHSARVTVCVLAVWIVTALSVPMPVPALGLGMWLATLVMGWLSPGHRIRTLWQGKNGVLVYGLACLGLLLFTRVTADLDAAEWSALLGSVREANTAIAQGKGIVLTIATVAIWYAWPVGVIGWMVKEFGINQGSLVAPGRTTAEIVHAIRTRGGLAE